MIGQVAGNSPASAHPLGQISSTTATAKGWVGALDPTNYFSFKLATAGSVHLALTSAAAGAANFSVETTSGTVIAKTASSATAQLKAGTYFLRVGQASGGSHSNYTLT